jgi:hypothetical protein
MAARRALRSTGGTSISDLVSSAMASVGQPEAHTPQPIHWSRFTSGTSRTLHPSENEEVAAKHPYTGERLHIEMFDRPVIE